MVFKLTTDIGVCVCVCSEKLNMQHEYIQFSEATIKNMATLIPNSYILKLKDGCIEVGCDTISAYYLYNMLQDYGLIMISSNIVNTRTYKEDLYTDTEWRPYDESPYFNWKLSDKNIKCSVTGTSTSINLKVYETNSDVCDNVIKSILSKTHKKYIQEARAANSH
jgi:hypothetical protein